MPAAARPKPSAATALATSRTRSAKTRIGGAVRGPRRRPGEPEPAPLPVTPRMLGLELRPGLVDPGEGRRRLTLRPAGRRRDAADRDHDDAVGVEDRERVLRHVLAEADDGVLVPLMVVGPDVDVPGGARDHRALQH